GTFNDLEKTRQVLMGFLDRISGATDLVSAYSEIMDVWLAERDAREHFDWRYYLVKYPAMRSGWSGQYMSEDGEPGYRLCMLKRTRITSYYRDPYLLEIYNQVASVDGGEYRDRVEDTWYYGDENQPRWLTLSRSGVGIRCVTEGFEIRPPADVTFKEGFEAMVTDLPSVEVSQDRILLRIPQNSTDTGPIDSEDRIIIAVSAVKDLIAASF